MVSDPRFEETLRRTVEANLRFYESLGKVTLDYLKALADTWSGAGLPWKLGGPSPAPSFSAAAAPPAPSPPSPVLVLEGEAGERARGVFLVANKLSRRVSAPVVAAAFADPGGREVHPPLRVEPEVVTLDPGGQSLVQIEVTVEDDLEPGVGYRSEISVPGLSDTGVPVVLRRRAAAPAAPAAKAAAKARAPRPAAGRKTRRKRS